MQACMHACVRACVRACVDVCDFLSFFHGIYTQENERNVNIHNMVPIIVTYDVTVTSWNTYDIYDICWSIEN